jgi:hypothetical protein
MSRDPICTKTSRIHNALWSLHASIVSVHASTALFGASKAPKFELNAVPEPASKNTANTDPQPCYKGNFFIG